MSGKAKVVDTNVPLVANGQHSDVSPECVAECALALQEIMRKGRIALDDSFRILTEYQNKTTPRKGNRPGDAFIKWALRNNANPAKCDLVKLREHPKRKFESFPDDNELEGFDLSDRVFVAVAAAHSEKPEIFQAADSKWLDWAIPLERHDIQVTFVCREDIERFHRKKFGT
jgi:hypothetical protein